MTLSISSISPSASSTPRPVRRAPRASDFVKTRCSNNFAMNANYVMPTTSSPLSSTTSPSVTSPPSSWKSRSLTCSTAQSDVTSHLSSPSVTNQCDSSLANQMPVPFYTAHDIPIHETTEKSGASSSSTSSSTIFNSPITSTLHPSSDRFFPASAGLRTTLASCSQTIGFGLSDRAVSSNALVSRMNFNPSIESAEEPLNCSAKLPHAESQPLSPPIPRLVSFPVTETAFQSISPSEKLAVVPPSDAVHDYSSEGAVSFGLFGRPLLMGPESSDHAKEFQSPQRPDSLSFADGQHLKAERFKQYLHPQGEPAQHQHPSRQMHFMSGGHQSIQPQEQLPGRIKGERCFSIVAAASSLESEALRGSVPTMGSIALAMSSPGNKPHSPVIGHLKNSPVNNIQVPSSDDRSGLLSHASGHVAHASGHVAHALSPLSSFSSPHGMDYHYPMTELSSLPHQLQSQQSKQPYYSTLPIIKMARTSTPVSNQDQSVNLTEGGQQQHHHSGFSSTRSASYHGANAMYGIQTNLKMRQGAEWPLVNNNSATDGQPEVRFSNDSCHFPSSLPFLSATSYPSSVNHFHQPLDYNFDGQPDSLPAATNAGIFIHAVDSTTAKPAAQQQHQQQQQDIPRCLETTFPLYIDEATDVSNANVTKNQGSSTNTVQPLMLLPSVSIEDGAPPTVGGNVTSPLNSVPSSPFPTSPMDERRFAWQSAR